MGLVLMGLVLMGLVLMRHGRSLSESLPEFKSPSFGQLDFRHP
jgi:hypothetical protein